MYYIKKNKDWILLNLPALVILISLVMAPHLHKTMRAWTGYIAFSLLILLLAINPLKVLFKNTVFLNRVNKYRRIIGVAVFTYSILHLLCFIIKKGGVSHAIEYIFHPLIITAFVSFVIFTFLAITSNNYSVKKIGYIRWKKLHEKVYIAEFGVMIHMILMGGNARVFGIAAFIPLMIVQYIRRIRKKRLKS